MISPMLRAALVLSGLVACRGASIPAEGNDVLPRQDQVTGSKTCADVMLIQHAKEIMERDLPKEIMEIITKRSSKGLLPAPPPTPSPTFPTYSPTTPSPTFPTYSPTTPSPTFPTISPATSSCGDNQHVFARQCIDCVPGATRAAGDDPNGGDTDCEPTLCGKDEAVFKNECVPCEAGKVHPKGAFATWADSDCYSICGKDERVINFECVPCPSGFSNRRGDETPYGCTECDDGELQGWYTTQDCGGGAPAPGPPTYSPTTPSPTFPTYSPTTPSPTWGEE